MAPRVAQNHIAQCDAMGLGQDCLTGDDPRKMSDPEIGGSAFG